MSESTESKPSKAGPKKQYKILKLPLTRETSVFYYYKSFEQLDVPNKEDRESLKDIPAGKSVYLCHFVRPIEEAFIQKYFGQVGKIRQIHTGKYKNPGCNKRKRRTVYFAIIVFKKESDAQRVVGGCDSKFMQSLVNKTLKKQVKSFSKFNGDEDEEEGDSDEMPEETRKRKEMEEGGFTVVQTGSENIHSKSKKHKINDGGATTMLGISQEEAKKAYRECLIKGQPIIGMDADEYEKERERVIAELKGEQQEEMLENMAVKPEGLPSLYTPKQFNKKEMQSKQSSMMYTHSLKQTQKEDLEKLRAQFDNYKRRMAKQLEKQRNRQKQLLGQ